MLQTILVSTHDSLNTRVDTSLSTSGGLLDTHLRHTCLDSLSHTTQLLDLLDMLPSLVNKLVGEGLYVVRTSPWVDLLADLCLILDIDLGITGDTSREVGRQGDSLVERVGMQRLGMSEHGSHSLDTCTTNVVERILLGE